MEYKQQNEQKKESAIDEWIHDFTDALVQAFALEFAVAFVTLLFAAGLRLFFPHAPWRELIWPVLIFQLFILALALQRGKR